MSDILEIRLLHWLGAAWSAAELEVLICWLLIVFEIKKGLRPSKLHILALTLITIGFTYTYVLKIAVWLPSRTLFAAIDSIRHPFIGSVQRCLEIALFVGAILAIVAFMHHRRISGYVLLLIAITVLGNWLVLLFLIATRGYGGPVA